MVNDYCDETFDAAVVGAGPAGLMGAYELAQRGVKTILIEKAHPPRYKTCGGGVVRKALSRLPFSIESVVEQYCYTAEVHLNDIGLHFRVERDQPIVAMVMRSTFDDLLLRAACDRGAVVSVGSEVIDVHHDADFVSLTTTKGRIQTKFLIAANGALSTVAKKIGLSDVRSLLPAVEYEVHLSRHDNMPCSSTARFDIGLLTKGYTWVFPKKDHLSIGAFSIQRGSTHLHRVMDRYMSDLCLPQSMSIEKHGFLIPMNSRGGEIVHGRILFVGDAAGFVDPVTAEGISSAILSGQFAARAISEGFGDQARVRKIYLNDVRRTIIPELRFGSMLARLLYNPSARSWIFRRYGQQLVEAVADVMTGARTYRGILTNPEMFLHLLAGTSG